MSTALLVVLILLIFFGGGGWWWYYHSGYGPRRYGGPVGPASQYGYDTTATTPTPAAPRPVVNHWGNPIGLILVIFVILLLLGLFFHPWQ